MSRTSMARKSEWSSTMKIFFEAIGMTVRYRTPRVACNRLVVWRKSLHGGGERRTEDKGQTTEGGAGRCSANWMEPCERNWVRYPETNADGRRASRKVSQ